MKYSCKTNKTVFQSQGTVFLVTDIRQIEILQTDSTSVKIKSQGPEMEQDPTRFLCPVMQEKGDSVLSTASMEILNDINEGPLLTFDMLFNKIVVSSIKSVSEIANY